MPVLTPDYPDKPVTIRGFMFMACSGPLCMNVSPCPDHQPNAWKQAFNKFAPKKGPTSDHRD